MDKQRLFSNIFFFLDTNFEIKKSWNNENIGKNFKKLVNEKNLEKKVKNKQNFSFSATFSKEGKYQFNIYKCDDEYFVSGFSLDEIEKLVEENKRLTEYSMKDQLTGAYNRYAFWDYGELMLNDIKREDMDLGIIFVDIDNLKLINTKRGYKGGDEIIKSVSNSIKKSIRKSDLYVRFGGDEFIVLLKIKGGKRDILEVICKRILDNVRRTKDNLGTVSLGAVNISNRAVRSTLRSRARDKLLIKHINKAERLSTKSKKLGKNQYLL